MEKLEDRVFLVTGATSGIGEFTAELLAKEPAAFLGGGFPKLGYVLYWGPSWVPIIRESHHLGY